MKYCQLCGLEKYQLCYHDKKCYLADTAKADLSASILYRLSELIAIEVKYYSEVLATIPFQDFQELQKPALGCLISIHQIHQGRQV